MGATNDEAYLCLKALASSVRREISLISPLIRHVVYNSLKKNKEKNIRLCISYVHSTSGLY